MSRCLQIDWSFLWCGHQTIFSNRVIKYKLLWVHQYSTKYNQTSTTQTNLSKAFTLPRSFLLFRQLMRTCVLFFTDCVRTDNGPVLNSSSSRFANSSGVNSLLGFGCNLFWHTTSESTVWSRQLSLKFYIEYCNIQAYLLQCVSVWFCFLWGGGDGSLKYNGATHPCW